MPVAQRTLPQEAIVPMSGNLTNLLETWKYKHQMSKRKKPRKTVKTKNKIRPEKKN